MEATLKRLFDFQAFENNRSLQGVIDKVHARYATRELDLDEMEYVAAAGSPELPKDEEGKSDYVPKSQVIVKIVPCPKCGHLNIMRKGIGTVKMVCDDCGHTWYES